MAKMQAPKGAISASFDGEEYPVRKGLVDVPAKAVATLIDHGFSPVTEEPVTEEQPAQ